MFESIIKNIEIYVTLLSILIAFVGFIDWIKKWDILKSVFFRKKFRYKFYRYINYLLLRNQKWIVDTKESYYEFKDRTHMLHRKKFNVISCVNVLTFFEDKYQWSKPGYTCKPRALIKDQKIAYEWIKDNSNSYLIQLEKPIPKNEVFESGIEIELEDDDKKSQLYLNASVYEKTKLLRLVVKFNGSLIPKDIKISIWEDFQRDIGKRFEKEILFNHVKSEIVYEEDYPMYKYRYKISWNFNE